MLGVLVSWNWNRLEMHIGVAPVITVFSSQNNYFYYENESNAGHSYIIKFIRHQSVFKYLLIIENKSCTNILT